MSVVATNRIQKSPGVCGGKACVLGTRIRVQDIYVWHELQGRSPDEIVHAFPQLTHADVHAALAYYWDHVDEIENDMARAESLLQRLRQRQQSPLEDWQL
jgi:uncharacterized protein (DUF433 family)